MEELSNLEERFKLVIELNETLEEITNINKQLKLMKVENLFLKSQNNDMQNVVLEKENIFNKLKSKNEILETESIKIDKNIDELKKALI